MLLAYLTERKSRSDRGTEPDPDFRVAELRLRRGQSMKSHSSANPVPPAIAAPFTAAMVAFGNSCSDRNSAPWSRSLAGSALAFSRPGL